MSTSSNHHPRVEVVDITVQATDYVRDTMRVVVRYLQPAGEPAAWRRRPAAAHRSAGTEARDRAREHDRRRRDAEKRRSPATHDTDREHDRQRLRHLDRTRQ